jgi:macrolide-specific efflux system membrane fusion protein
MQLPMIALAAVLALTGPQAERSGQDPGVVDHCLITLIEEADVPAEQPGVLWELTVVEGQQVTKGELLGHLDDRMPKKQEEVAQYKLEAARAEAGNDINVRFARSASAVAQAELDQMHDANQKQQKTFPALEVRRAALEVRKAELQIEQAAHELKLAALKANVQQGELDAAILEIQRCQITSPLNGAVVKRYVQQREWLKPGDPVVHVVRMDRLRVKATLDGSQIAPSEVDSKPVTVEVMLAHDRVEKFAGKVVYISPEWTGGSRFDVWAEVYNRQENGKWLLGYNMDARMTIHWR